MSGLREHAPAVVVFSIEFYLLPAPHVIVASLADTYPVLLQAGLYTFTEALIDRHTGGAFSFFPDVIIHSWNYHDCLGGSDWRPSRVPDVTKWPEITPRAPLLWFRRHLLRALRWARRQ